MERDFDLDLDLDLDVVGRAESRCRYPRCRVRDAVVDKDGYCTKHPRCAFPECTLHVAAKPKGLRFCVEHAMIDDSRCDFPRCWLKKDDHGQCPKHRKCVYPGCRKPVRMRPKDLKYCDAHGHLRQRSVAKYCITNRETGQEYTGSTWDIASCLAKHRLYQTVGTTSFDVKILNL